MDFDKIGSGDDGGDGEEESSGIEKKILEPMDVLSLLEESTVEKFKRPSAVGL
jgi:hypothetical protein